MFGARVPFPENSDDQVIYSLSSIYMSKLVACNVAVDSKQQKFEKIATVLLKWRLAMCELKSTRIYWWQHTSQNC